MPLGAIGSITSNKQTLPAFIPQTVPNYDASTGNSSTYSQTIQVTNKVGDMRFSGTLPAGMSFDEETGTLSGVPSEYGTFNFTLSANSYTNLVVSQNYTFTVVPYKLNTWTSSNASITIPASVNSISIAAVGGGGIGGIYGWNNYKASSAGGGGGGGCAWGVGLPVQPGDTLTVVIPPGIRPTDNTVWTGMAYPPYARGSANLDHRIATAGDNGPDVNVYLNGTLVLYAQGGRGGPAPTRSTYDTVPEGIYQSPGAGGTYALYAGPRGNWANTGGGNGGRGGYGVRYTATYGGVSFNFGENGGGGGAGGFTGNGGDGADANTQYTTVRRAGWVSGATYTGSETGPWKIFTEPGAPGGGGGGGRGRYDRAIRIGGANSLTGAREIYANYPYNSYIPPASTQPNTGWSGVAWYSNGSPYTTNSNEGYEGHSNTYSASGVISGGAGIGGVNTWLGSNVPEADSGLRKAVCRIVMYYQNIFPSANSAGFTGTP